MGHQKGIELIEKTDKTECLIIVKNKKGALKNYYSSGFKKLEISARNNETINLLTLN